MVERFEAMLTGGHPNSSGRTIEVVDAVLADPERFDGLFACYSNADEGIRLRVTNATARVEKQRRDLLVSHLNRLADDPGKPVDKHDSKGVSAVGKGCENLCLRRGYFWPEETRAIRTIGAL